MQIVRKMFFCSDHDKGLHYIRKEHYVSQMQEAGMRKECERKLTVFNRCVVDGKDHLVLQKEMQPLHTATSVAEVLECIRVRLRLFRLLQIAHNAGSVRQQRRAKVKLEHSFDVQVQRDLTRTLPSELAEKPFLTQSVSWQKRSKASRMREYVRG